MGACDRRPCSNRCPAARPRCRGGALSPAGSRTDARPPPGRDADDGHLAAVVRGRGPSRGPHVEDVELTYRRKEADPDGAWLVWDDGGPVSLAAYGNPTPSGIRVGPVYTPPELRGRGYATSLVAELTAERLAAGSAFCFLITDLSNPTSNVIYARIGYEPVADWDQWSFQPLER